jgi:cobaltochelatase CobN
MLRQGRHGGGLRCGQVFVGIQPARGYQLDPMASYHDPDLVPPHYYLAFYHRLRSAWQADAMVHGQARQPGMAAGQERGAVADLLAGPGVRAHALHLYPFIVNDPGRGAGQRRAQAVIVDHLMPPLTRAEELWPHATWSAWWTSTTRQ